MASIPASYLDFFFLFFLDTHFLSVLFENASLNATAFTRFMGIVSGPLCAHSWLHIFAHEGLSMMGPQHLSQLQLLRWDRQLASDEIDHFRHKDQVVVSEVCSLTFSFNA